MFAFLKAVHYVSLLLLCGGPVFWLAVWRPIYGHQVDDASSRFARRVRFGVAIGAIVFVSSGFAEAV